MDHAAKTSGESELWSAIVAFERILEVMPNDRLALETLADAYQKLGDITRASQYLNRLAEGILGEQDAQACSMMLDKFKTLLKDPSLAQLCDQLQAVVKAPEKNKAGDDKPASNKKADITREIALAWDLLQAGLFSQEDYSAIVQDLSESSSKRVDVPVTVLHALHDRQFKGADKVLAYLSRTSNKPVLPLSNFELNQEACKLLPMDYMSKRGAIAYDLMGGDVLVAILNPFDKDLLEDVQRTTRKRCHFYLVTATDYDATLTNARKIMSGT